jgi:hypothetical protein
MLLAAEELCRLLAKYTPLIVSLFPSNTALRDALEGANAACSLLATELKAVREVGD